jgi:predicted CXXCH cytochrome family protein
MNDDIARRQWRRSLVLKLGLSAGAALGLAIVRGDEPCLACHGTQELSMDLPDGSKLRVSVDAAAFAGSVHGGRLTCSDCHRSYSTYPHAPVRVQTRRDYSVAQYEVCKSCHFANYTKTLDSIHYDQLSQGNPIAPLCTDCHGAHNVAAPDKPRAKISQTCSACHSSVYQAYTASIHGKALVGEANGDVPVCTDCHGSHNIHDPRTASFRLETPSLCARCHSDSKLMEKYGISDQVTKTYLQDYHGVSISLYQKQEGGVQPSRITATCTDCHGIHDITSTDAPNSPVMKANLLKTCQKCHPDATENFPNAWLSHYQPSLSESPLVYIVKLGYSFIIPFVIGGLSLHVLLDIWRALRGR